MSALTKWEIDTVVELTPKTRKANNRLSNHKGPFVIIDAQMRVQFTYRGGPWLLVGNKCNPLWWVHAQDDEHFVISPAHVPSGDDSDTGKVNP